MILTPYKLRWELHSYPELAFEEFKTTQLLETNIEEMARFYQVDLKIYKPLPTGLIVEYSYSQESDEYILFRADIDALNIKEQTNAKFKSKNEYMHACGHDVHTAILYGFLLDVVKNKLKKNIIFLFQPAEESKGGAKKIIESKFLERFNIKNVFALHVTDEYTLGTIASTAGVMFASSMEVLINFQGEASHLAFPQYSKNALNALRLFLESVEKIPRDPMIPFIFGIGKVNAGRAINIIPDEAKLEGSVRTINLENNLEYFQKLKNILEGIFLITGVSYTLDMGSLYAEVENDKELFNKFAPILSQKFDFVECGLKMTAEDFGFISKRYPSLMCWVGTSKGEKYGLHSPKFLPPDEVIDIGINLLKTFIEI
ncbi:MAG TPA: amidohydrolase [Defluviitoga sp.]|nr:amidohydrolase [Defluviitoga sp.]HOP24254.1 amidohydrolase [Defluviitoga sp.]HPZ28154.1 amidohydrolase [Defluviitoga sp.]HQD62044.1 amidohydrolase [Defluviitoga sp.]